MTGDDFIKSGFWAQLLLLVLVDWGSLVAFQNADHVPWYHWAGLISVNVVLLGASWFFWLWLRSAKSRDVIDAENANDA